MKITPPREAWPNRHRPAPLRSQGAVEEVQRGIIYKERKWRYPLIFKSCFPVE